MEYEKLEKISVKKIVEVLGECSDIHKFAYLAMCKGYSYISDISLEDILDLIKDDYIDSNWFIINLINSGLLNFKEVFFKRGDRFKHPNYGECLLVQTGFNEMALIPTDPGHYSVGNRLLDPIKVEDPKNVTIDELKKMTYYFNKLEKIS